MWVGPFLSCLLSDQAEVTLLLLPLLVLSWSCTPLETCAFCLAMARSLAIALLLLAPVASFRPAGLTTARGARDRLAPLSMGNFFDSVGKKVTEAFRTRPRRPSWARAKTRPS